MREPPVLEQTEATWVRHRGRRLAYFAGSDYLRLSWHPDVRAAVAAAVAEGGGATTTSASRMTTGNRAVYGKVEASVRRHFGGGVATLASAGYLAPWVAVQGLASGHTHVVRTDRAHACLVDAARLSGLPVATFPAGDAPGLRKAVAGCGRRARVLVMTDGLAPTSGEVSPVGAYLAVLPASATLLVDDAHGVGVLGRRGRGTLEWAGVGVDVARVVLTFTLSKAFGVYGGVVLGNGDLRRSVLERSGVFTGNTPLPPPLAAGAVAAMEVMRREGAIRRERLWAAVARVKEAFVVAGRPVPPGPGPVIPVVPPTPRAALRLQRRLVAAGIHPPQIRYPGGPADRFFRFALSSEHDAQQVDTLRSVLVDYLGHDT